MEYLKNKDGRFISVLYSERFYEIRFFVVVALLDAVKWLTESIDINKISSTSTCEYKGLQCLQ